MSIEPRTLKGFRDFLPEEARRRQFVISVLRNIFESFDFAPLETPALEYEEILTGKYGEEGDKLMYRFEDNGGRRVALRYDQTVPLARVIAQYQHQLPMPFKRYQIQNVWRAENTQKGRFREFLQCDADIIGSTSTRADVQIISVAAAGLKALGFENFRVLINDRSIFEGLSKGTIIAIDKLKKIGREGVIQELVSKEGYNEQEAEQTLSRIENATAPTRLQEIFENLNLIGKETVPYIFSPTLARGLEYYTGLIFEIEVEGYTAGSVCGGGRYDDLIGMFSKEAIPAVGFSYGFDRLLEAMEVLGITPQLPPMIDILVTVFSEDLASSSVSFASRLREQGFRVEVYLDEANLDKQIKYAVKKGVPYLAIIGPDEAHSDMVTIKTLATGEQARLSQNEATEFLLGNIQKENS